MMHLQFLRIKKLTGKHIIEVAARHNHREILAELGATPGGHIDPARVAFNRVLCGHGTAADVASRAKMLMDDAGVKDIRKDAVRALEIIISLPPQSSIDQDSFFNEVLRWAEHYFAVPVISAIVHNDEAAPHCHILLLPLVDGRMVGSDLMGGRAKLVAMHADFHAKVGHHHGLSRQTVQARPSAATRKNAIDSAFKVLKANSGLSDAVLLALLAPHAREPAPLLLALGLAMPTPKSIEDSFVEMMTKPCKPEKPIGFGRRKPIGFDGSTAPEKAQTLSCVGFAISTPPFSPSNEPQPAITDATIACVTAMTEQADDANQAALADSTYLPEADGRPTSTFVPSLAEAHVIPINPKPTDTEGDYTRERDDDKPVEQWSDDLGEFIEPTFKPSRKPAVIASIRAAMEARSWSRDGLGGWQC